MSGYRFSVRPLRSPQNCWLCNFEMTASYPAHWDNWNKKNGNGQATCRPCAEKEQEAGKGSIKPQTETPATRAGASVNTETSFGGGSPNITSEFLILMKELVNTMRSIDQKLDGLIPQARKDFSPPVEEPVLKPEVKKEPPPEDPNWISILERLHDINRQTHSLVSLSCRLEKYADDGVVISMKESYAKALTENRKEHLEKALLGLPLTLKTRTF